MYGETSGAPCTAARASSRRRDGDTARYAAYSSADLDILKAPSSDVPPTCPPTVQIASKRLLLRASPTAPTLRSSSAVMSAANGADATTSEPSR
jgi:hypothetical protein